MMLYDSTVHFSETSNICCGNGTSQVGAKAFGSTRDELMYTAVETFEFIHFNVKLTFLPA